MLAKSKALPLLLSVVLTIGLCPIPAFAGPLTVTTTDLVVQSAGVDDYPSNLKSAAKDSLIDPWNFYNRECTSFVAWRLNNDNGVAFSNWYGGVRWGNACDWASAARSLGITVNSSPAVGSVAWWSGGHVAWVQSVSGGNVTIEEYNYNNSGNYNRRTISASSVSGFIHIRDLISNDHEGPSVSDFHVWQVSDSQFTVSANVADSSGIKSVKYAVWTTNNGRDDLVWYNAVYETTGKFWWTYVPISEHNNERNNYIIDIYAYDNADNCTTSRISFSRDAGNPTFDNFHVWEITDAKFTVSAKVSTPNTLSSVKYAVWTTANGQDDLVWQDAVYETTGKFWWIYVPFADHNNELGDYIIDIYAYDTAGNAASSRLCYRFDSGQPAIDDLHVWELKDSQFTVSAKVQAPNGVSAVRYAVWTEDNGQDDLIWHDAAYETTGKFWWLYVKFGDHNNEKGKYIIHMYVYDRAGNVAFDGIGYNVTGNLTNATVSISPQTYSGSKITPKPIVKYDDETLAEGTDYSLDYSNNINVGTATVTIIGKGRFAGSSKTSTFEIAAIDISDATVATPNQTFTGFALSPTATVSLNGTTLTFGTDYEVSYANNVNAGTATVTVTGKGSYAGSKSAEFTIAPASIASASVAVADQAYTGKALIPAPAVKLGSATLKAGTDYSVGYKDNVNEGAATVTVTGKGNYAGEKSATFKIAKQGQPAPSAKSIAGATVSGLKAKTYTGKPLTQSPAVRVGSKTLKQEADYTLSYKDNVNAGTATVTVKGKGGYTGTKSATFKIDKAKNPIAVKAKSPLVKASKVKKANRAIAAKSAFAVSRAQGKVSYKKISGNKKVAVSSAGKIVSVKTPASSTPSR